MDRNACIEKVFYDYKITCARLMRLGKLNNIEMLFRDSECIEKDSNLMQLISKMKGTDDDDVLYIQHVNFAYLLLNRVERKIIMNDFIFPIEKFWYMKEYSRSTYYRIREKAIKKFLDLMGMI